MINIFALEVNQKKTYLSTKSQVQQHFLLTPYEALNWAVLWIQRIEQYELHLCMQV
jgi:hypothetical protein